MAVGRRKRFANGALGTSMVTLLTAGAAPADGSAAATVWVTLVNTTNASVNVATTIQVAGNSVYQSNLPPSSTTDINQQGRIVLGPYDLMGGEIIQGQCGVNTGVVYNITGIEAKDS